MAGGAAAAKEEEESSVCVCVCVCVEGVPHNCKSAAGMEKIPLQVIAAVRSCAAVPAAVNRAQPIKVGDPACACVRACERASVRVCAFREGVWVGAGRAAHPPRSRS